MKRNIITIMLFLLVVSSVHAAWYTNATAVYEFELNTTQDSFNFYNGTDGPASLYRSPGIVGNGSNDGFENQVYGWNITNQAAFNPTVTMTVGAWINSSESGDGYIVRKGASTLQFYIYQYSNGSIGGGIRTGGSSKDIVGPALIDLVPYPVILTYNGSLLQLYVSNVSYNLTISSGSTLMDTTSDVITVRSNAGSSTFNGQIDNLFFTNYTINFSDVQQFSSESPLVVPVGGNKTLMVQAKDVVTNQFIDGLCIRANGTNTTQSICSTGNNVSYSTIGIYDITVYSIGVGNNISQTYFNVSVTNYNFSENNNIIVNTSQGLINLSAYQLYLNTSIITFNATNNKTSTNMTGLRSLLINASLGNNNIRIFTPGNYSLNTTCTLSTPLTTGFCNATGVYDDLFNLSAVNGINGNGITNFSVNMTNNSINANTLVSTTNGSVFIPTVQGYFYNFLYIVTGFATTNFTLPANASQNNYTANLSLSNSVYLTYYDENNGSLITKNVTSTFENTTFTFSNISNTGYALVTGLAAGVWTISSTAQGYNTKINTITISDDSSQNLTIYLGNGTNNVVFTVFNSVNPNLVLQGASISMYRTVNGTSVLVESHTTDITGRAQFTYETNTYYSFIVSATGYQTRIFSLSPIIFSSYDIPMIQINSTVGSVAYSDISLYYTPQVYYNNQQNNLTFFINSPNGELTTYNFSVAYPGGSASFGGTNAMGQSFNYLFNITTSSLFETVNITYSYTDTDGIMRNFSFQHGIIGAAGNNTIIANRDQTYGMGILERGLIGTVTVILFGGIASFVAGPIIGGTLGLFIMGYLYYIGFFPLLAVLLSIMVGFFIIARRSGE